MQSVLQDRDKYLGGSDLPKLITEPNLYKFAKEKLNPTFKGNTFTYYGQFMEAKIRNYVNDQLGFRYTPKCIIDGIYRGNCDGLERDRLMEIKTYGCEVKLEYYIPQIQLYLHLFKLKKAYLYAYRRPDNFFQWGDETHYQSYNLEFDPERLKMFEINYLPKKFKEIDFKAQLFFKAFRKLVKNPKMTEREFNICLYGKEFVEGIESYEKSKKIANFCSKLNLTKCKIGNMMVTYQDVTEITIDSSKLWQDLPNIFDNYKTLKRSKQLNIRKCRDVAEE